MNQKPHKGTENPKSNKWSKLIWTTITEHINEETAEILTQKQIHNEALIHTHTEYWHEITNNSVHATRHNVKFYKRNPQQQIQFPDNQ